MKMYKLGRYKQTDRMSDLICENYPMLLVLSRFGISLGFGDKTIGEVCEDSGVDTKTFLTIVNLLLDDHTTAEQIDPSLSVETLVSYLQNSHSYFLDFRLPLIRRKLIEAIDCGHSDVSFAIMRYFDQYVAEVRKHMNYEETTVFPYVRSLVQGKSGNGKYHIGIFSKQHDQVEAGRAQEYHHQILSGYRKQRAQQRAVRHILLRNGSGFPQPHRGQPVRAADRGARAQKRLFAMSTSMKIAVAEPSVIIRSGLLSVLGRLTTLNIQILEIAEIAQLGSALCRQKPDMLIVNPALLGMFSLQKIKSEAGCLPMKCIALQYSVTDSSTLKAYDQTISIYDTAEQIKEKLPQLHGSEAGGKEHDALSAREREIVVCVVKGMTNKQIAEKLCLSLHTVITHRRNIAGKLQIHSPAGLTIYAIVNKLVELSEIKETISDSDQ